MQPLIFGQRYRILRTNKEVVEGERIQTKGDDENYPTFLLDDGGRLGVARANVLGPADDSCSVEGIQRPAEGDLGVELDEVIETLGDVSHPD